MRSRQAEIAALAGLAALLVGGAAGRAASRPLWHDEIFTLYIAAVPTAADLWRALKHAVDLNPPLYHLSVRLWAALLGSGAFATRLTAIAGYLVATLAIYAFCRRRLPASFAWLGATVLVCSGAYPYAYEGRPYGLVLGWCALALLAWQSRSHPRWRGMAPVMCAVALAGAFWTHYYALLMVLPLAAGELLRTWRRRIDWLMWGALVASPLALVPLLPLIGAAREFAGTFWSRPALSDVAAFYGDLVSPLSLIVLAAGIAAWGAWLIFDAPASPSRDARTWAFPAEDTVAVVVLLAVPLFAFAAAVLVTGAFHPRYVLYAALSLAILAAGWAHASGLRGASLQAFLVIIALAFAARQAAGMAALLRTAPDPLARDRSLLSRVPSGSSVVVSHALTFVPLVYYGGGSPGPDLVYLARPAAVVRELGVDTGSRALQRLSTIAPVHVEDLEAFVSGHPRFYVYGPPSWLMPHLLQRGAAAEILATAGDRSLYRVEVPSPMGGARREAASAAGPFMTQPDR